MVRMTKGVNHNPKKSQHCNFVFVNEFRAKFPCQRPKGHRGAHSLSRWKEDERKPR